MLPEDIYALESAGDPRLSPDARAVAYVVQRVDRTENAYRSAIYVAAADGSSPPRRLTEDGEEAASPRWSPDGRLLAFVSNGEHEKKQLYVLPAAGGEPKRLTELAEDVTEVAWSPTGDRLAFSARVREAAYEEEDEKRRAPRRITRLRYKLDDVGWTTDRRQHVFTVPADGSAGPAQLTAGDYEDGAPTWSPDGTRIAFVSAREEDWDVQDVRDVYVVDAAGGEPVRVTDGSGSCAASSWSPDGSLIAFHYFPGHFDEPRHGRVAVVQAGGGAPRILTEALDRNCAPYPQIREPVWDGDGIVFSVEDAGNTHVYRVAADGSGEPELVVGGELAVTGYDARAGQVAYTATTPTSPPELYGPEGRLTELGRSLEERAALAEAERFTATSADGSEIDAWIVRPADLEAGARYPVFLSIHGGPFTQYGNRFLDEFQVYAGAGYVVLYANPRGSSGYSEEWGRAIRGPVDGGPGWGSVDYDDLMAVVDEALERFELCDPDRLGVIGGSYGGFMTTWMLGHTERFRAGCSERALNNFVSAFGSGDLDWGVKAFIGAFLFEDVDAYLRLSPTTYAPNIQTPLLILHSENDLRCHVEQGEHLFTMLRLLGREVEFVRFPAEGHELSRSGSPAHRVMRFDIILDWFARHLGA
ncbi:MAG TPA: S9 family peptidase [Gaiellaceae bacterium]|nr:S9 family peptidase [Gaiellaceae bacterium]